MCYLVISKYEINKSYKNLLKVVDNVCVDVYYMIRMGNAFPHDKANPAKAGDAKLQGLKTARGSWQPVAESKITLLQQHVRGGKAAFWGGCHPSAGTAVFGVRSRRQVTSTHLKTET